MTVVSINRCPCGSGRLYEKCCQPAHEEVRRTLHAVYGNDEADCVLALHKLAPAALQRMVQSEDVATPTMPHAVDDAEEPFDAALEFDAAEVPELRYPIRDFCDALAPWLSDFRFGRVGPHGERLWRLMAEPLSKRESGLALIDRYVDELIRPDVPPSRQDALLLGLMDMMQVGPDDPVGLVETFHFVTICHAQLLELMSELQDLEEIVLEAQRRYRAGENPDVAAAPMEAAFRAARERLGPDLVAAYQRVCHERAIRAQGP